VLTALRARGSTGLLLTPLFRTLIAGFAAVALGYSVSATSADLPGAPGATGFDERVLWALNVGGDAFTSRAGERFQPDDCASGQGRCGVVDVVARTQNHAIYRSFRRGDQRYSVPVEPGDYDVVLYFVEVAPGKGGSRRFNVEIESETVFKDFKVARADDATPATALTRSFTARQVDDGFLDIELVSREGEAVLSGILVRQSQFSTAGWELAWSEEFDQPQLDSTVWTVEEWAPRRVNDEDQEYRNDQRNVRLEDGVLILEAHYEGPEEPVFSSGRIHSSGTREILYGRLDVRARIPEGRGVWPAIWLMPSDPYRYATKCGPSYPDWQGSGECDAWPNSGEIDLMEHVGNETAVVHGTVHTRDYYGKLGTQVGEAIVIPDLGTSFHTYSLVWEPGMLSMFVDGQRYFSYFDDGVGIGQWPFDHTFHVILNLAVGGYWGRDGGPPDITAFPQRMEVDFVRAYERAADE